MSSTIVTSWYIFPLYTWNFSPTKFGKIVAARALVLIGIRRCPGAGRTIGSLFIVEG